MFGVWNTEIDGVQFFMTELQKWEIRPISPTFFKRKSSNVLFSEFFVHNSYVSKSSSCLGRCVLLQALLEHHPCVLSQTMLVVNESSVAPFQVNASDPHESIRFELPGGVGTRAFLFRRPSALPNFPPPIPLSSYPPAACLLVLFRSIGARFHPFVIFFYIYK